MNNNAGCSVLILGGGRGTRLFPLTLERSKPAIGFAGKYRLIDIPISNSINSGYNKIFVLTQFLSASLHGHLMQTYRFDNFSKGFVEILSAEQSHKSSEWFQGTADAVRCVLRHLRYMPEEHVLILSGDHLYKMDYRKMLNYHVQKNAEVTVSSIFVDESEASRMGILDVSAFGRLNRVIEKPANVKKLKISSKSIKQDDGMHKEYCASMGIYLFNKDVLFNILSTTKSADFGKHILPLLVKNKAKVFSYDFNGYWRDIGTIKSYYDASMDLLSDKPGFDLFDANMPLLTRARLLPPNKIIDSKITRSIISEGCLIKKASIENSIIGLRSYIKDNAIIKNSVIIGNDYYSDPLNKDHSTSFIGKGVILERTIVDKNVTICDFTQITDKRNHKDMDGDLYYIRDGVTIVRRGVVIPPHSII
ncbi:MAG: glucose-1-phosphate adenylyltransferase [Candidatus Omnitrophica bacterium]|nr:glucose-1-phosphate adenylyltransferase [Candidatus Omnitrophota bacterium]